MRFDMDKHVNSVRIRSIRKVLLSWHKIIEKYVANFNNDVPWWYNETATLSTLAAAVWEAGDIALTDYSTQKGSQKNPFMGRCDLYMGLDSHQFVCEAKQVWCNISPKARTKRTRVESGLKSACDDARKHPKNEERRLGICFAVPRLHERYEKSIDHQLKEWLRMIQGLEYSSIAWVFPKKARHLKLLGVDYFYPGVVLLVKEV